MRLGKTLLLAFCIWAVWHWYHSRPVSHVPPGPISAELPEQTDTHQAPFSFGQYQITPRAHFKIKARVLSRENYSSGKESDLVPTDLALGWGRMSDVAIYSQLDISQHGRFYFWRYADQPPIPENEIVRSSANMHLIPGDAYVKKQISKVRPGQVVSFEGYLVSAQDDSGWRWNSSLTREDSGGGACELVWVESFSIEP